MNDTCHVCVCDAKSMSLVQLWYPLYVVIRCDYCVMKYKEKYFLMLCTVYIRNKAAACDNGLFLVVVFTKWRKTTASFVSPHATTGLPIEIFSSNLVFEYFSIICREFSSFV